MASDIFMITTTRDAINRFGSDEAFSNHAIEIIPLGENRTDFDKECEIAKINAVHSMKAVRLYCLSLDEIFEYVPFSTTFKYVEVNGLKHPTREVELNDGQIVRVSVEALGDIMADAINDGTATKEMRAVDDEIMCYIPDEVFVSDEETIGEWIEANIG